MDQQIEQRLQVWLARESAAFAAPATLQRRVREIPVSVPARRPWWTTRFSLVAAPAATAVVLAMAVFASSVLNVFDRPAGIDGGLCSNRQVHQALDGLRDAPGYRYESRDELYDFDVDAEFSFDEPQFAWRTGLVAEGAYRAPDSVREVVTDVDGMDRGYVEHLQVGDTTWRRTGSDPNAWLRMPNPLPFANMVWGYVQAAFPAFQVPGVTSLDWGGTPAPEDIPGSGGCTVATLIPGDGIGDIVALRIDVVSGRAMGVYRGPPTDADVRHGALRYLFAMTWTTPDESEFVPPADAVDAPPEGGGDVAPPTPVPAQTPAPGAWEPQELPLPDGWSSASVNSLAHLGAGGFVAVGAADRADADGSYESVGVVWTSADGVSWEVLEDGPTAEYLAGLAWDGETLLAIGYRYVSRDTVEWEVWASPDGRDWALAASLGTEVNPGPPIPTSHGWVATATHLSASAEAGGGVQITPAVLLSSDGREWQETVLPDTGSGSLSSVLELDDGSLLAFGCESPGATNSTQFGEMCLTRPWRSEDAITWAPGPVLDLQLGTVVADGAGMLAIGGESEPGGAVAGGLYRSDDGETWIRDSFDFGTTPELVETGMGGGPEAILLVEGATYIEGSRPGVSPIGRPYPTLWRTTADGGWEELPIGFTEDGGSIEDMVAVDGRLVLVGSLAVGEMESRPVVWVQPAE